MARYLSDQNKVVLLHESGTYATASGAGQWIGEVTEFSIEDAENKLEDRFLGTSSRSFDNFQQGPRDVTSNLTYNASNQRFPFFAIGSVTETSGTNSVHTASEIGTDVAQSAFTSGPLNPPISFTLEDSKQAPGTGRNFVRTINGAIPNVVTITATQGEKVKVESEFIGQTLTSSSGATTAVTEDTKKPYLFDSSTLTVGGSVIDTAKEVTLEINNNLTAPHYLDASRDASVPFQGDKNYTLSVTVDLSSSDADMLYNDFYKSNNAFNAVWDLDQDATTGSQHTIYTMSGCIVTSMEVPSILEGATESTIEIRPKNITAQEWTSSSSSALFNPWA